MKRDKKTLMTRIELHDGRVFFKVSRAVVMAHYNDRVWRKVSKLGMQPHSIQTETLEHYQSFYGGLQMIAF